MANFLDSVFKKFSSQKDASVIGVDIGASSIKVVQMRRKGGRAILETYGELSLGPYAGIEVGRATKLGPEKIVEALNDVLKESNATTKSVALSIPMRQSLVAVIRMPQMEEKQLAQMIPIEARKYIPVPITEVSLDWFVIPKIDPEPDDYEGVPDGQHKMPQIEVLVVAIHNDVLQDFSTIISTSQLNASFFEIEMFSTVRGVIDSGDNTPIMMCDFGAGATKVYMVERGIIRDSHVINKGSQDITLAISQSIGVSVEFAERLKRNYGKNTKEQDDQIKQIIDLNLSPILSEMNTVLVNFQKKYNKNITKVYLVGGGALLHGLEAQAQGKLSIPVFFGDPFAKLETPAFLEGILKQQGLAFCGAIGLGLRKLHEME
ncbi:MAG: type IV pilus assembly protein PilM [Candidatus Pacebacteria bacterium]|nr:type IV pilus assembly protein PilM [Candidatus Paceibacterota bacterium]